MGFIIEWCFVSDLFIDRFLKSNSISTHPMWFAEKCGSNLTLNEVHSDVILVNLF